jgi:hypothetical protein
VVAAEGAAGSAPIPLAGSAMRTERPSTGAGTDNLEPGQVRASSGCASPARSTFRLSPASSSSTPSRGWRSVGSTSCSSSSPSTSSRPATRDGLPERRHRRRAGRSARSCPACWSSAHGWRRPSCRRVRRWRRHGPPRRGAASLRRVHRRSRLPPSDTSSST